MDKKFIRNKCKIQVFLFLFLLKLAIVAFEDANRTFRIDNFYDHRKNECYVFRGAAGHLRREKL